MKDYVYCILIGAFLTACTLSTSSPGENPESTITPDRSLPSPDHFLDSYWRMVDQPNPNENQFSILVYAMRLTGNNTLIIGSSTKDLVDLFDQPSVIIQLRDDVGQADLLSKSGLYTLGDIDFWVMDFKVRNLNANEIYLFIGDSESLVYYDKPIAKRIGSFEDPYVYLRTTYKIGTEQIFEASNYEISFWGWTPPPSLTNPNPTQTPEHVFHIDKLTLKIENITTHKISYLAIKILSDGQIISELVD